MTSVKNMPRGNTSSTCSCSFDESSSRHAGADTIRGHHADCCTFLEISARAGADGSRLAGACHRHDCRFEDMFGCPASCMAAEPGAVAAATNRGANGTFAR